MTNIDEAERRRRNKARSGYVHSNYHDYGTLAKEIGEQLSEESKKLLREWRKRKKVNKL